MKEYIIELLNSHKKAIIIIGIIIIIILILNIYLNSDKVVSSNLKNYIINKDFKLDKDGILYEKILSDNTYEEYQNDINNNKESSYQVLLFDIYNYQLTENLYNYTNGINSFLSATYDYTNEKLTYNYRTTYKTSNIIFSGSYDDDDFTCNNEYAFDAYIKGSEDDYCELIEYYIEDFNDIILKTITSTQLLNDMKK